MITCSLYVCRIASRCPENNHLVFIDSFQANISRFVDIHIYVGTEFFHLFLYGAWLLIAKKADIY